MPSAIPVPSCNAGSFFSCCFSFSFPAFGRITVLALSGIGYGCTHITDGGRVHIYFMIDVLNKAPSSNTLSIYLRHLQKQLILLLHHPLQLQAKFLYYLFSYHTQDGIQFISVLTENLFRICVPWDEVKEEKKEKRRVAWMTPKLQNSSASSVSMESESIALPSSLSCPSHLDLVGLETPALGV